METRTSPRLLTIEKQRQERIRKNGERLAALDLPAATRELNSDFAAHRLSLQRSKSQPPRGTSAAAPLQRAPSSRQQHQRASKEVAKGLISTQATAERHQQQRDSGGRILVRLAKGRPEATELELANIASKMLKPSDQSTGGASPATPSAIATNPWEVGLK